MISDPALREFHDIWKAEFGATIPDDVAIEEATALLTVMDAIYRPLRKSDENEYGTPVELSQ